MSWCGGGEMSPTPGVAWRVLAIHGHTLLPGSWPPSPGFAPWAILICRSSALTRYSLVRPERAGGDLLPRRAAPRVVEAVDVLAALAGVRLAAEVVHGDGERLVRLGRDRP